LIAFRDTINTGKQLNRKKIFLKETGFGKVMGIFENLVEATFFSFFIIFNITASEHDNPLTL
jgi:hypothetical protein